MERRRRRQQHARADGFGRGGAATAWAAAALSARARRLRSAVRCTGKRGGAGTRGGGGEQASGPRAARRTGDRQAGDGPESDRAQRSGRADRRSAAADLEGVRSATVGVGGRPSCGEEGGRQVRVVRVALHRPVERHSSRDRAWATKSRWGRWEVGRDSFRAFKSGFARSATLGLPRKVVRLERGLLGRPNSHLAGLLMFS